MASRDEIARLEAMHAANPEGRVFAHLAEAYRKGGELERARDVLTAGLERHPQYASAHVVMGRVLTDLGERPAADSAFRRVLELDPHNMVALRARGDIAHEEGNDREALGFYRELITLDPSDEQAVLRIAEIESRPAAPAADETAAEGPAGAATPDVPAAPEVAATPDVPASIDETQPTQYGEATLPIAGEPTPDTESAPETEPSPAFEAMDFGAVSIADGAASVAGMDATGDVDLQLGGALEPTDVAVPGELPPPELPPMPVIDASSAADAADAFAGLGAFEPRRETVPDAVVDLSGMGGAFTLPPEPADVAAPEGPSEPGEPGELASIDDAAAPAEAASFALPGFDEIAGEATPEPAAEPAAEPLPTAPADEPAPAPSFALPDEPEPAPSFAVPDEPEPAPVATDKGADFDALWSAYDDGAAAALPDVGPELITETIGDLYSQQGLHERAADVYERLLQSRSGDAVLQSKLDAARAALSGETTVGGEPDLLAPGTPAPETAEFVASETPESLAPEFLAPEAVEAEPEEPEPAPFDLAAFADDGGHGLPEPAEIAIDLPPLPDVAADAFALPELAEGGTDPFALPEPAAAEPEAPIVPIEALEMEPVAVDDTPRATPEAAPSGDVERVEAAWTGGAGTGSDTASPFGWSEPEAATPRQSTIGEYFDRLVAEAPAVPEAPAAPETPAASEPLVAAEAPAAPDDAAPAPAPAEPAASAPPAGGDGYDDIDALFGEVPAAPAEAVSPSSVPYVEPAFTPAAPAAPEAPVSDDIDALFRASPEPVDETTPAVPAPLAPESPEGLVPEPSAPEEPAQAEVAATPTEPTPRGDFAWDPFAELAPELPASAAETVPGVEDASAGAAGSGVEDASAATGGSAFEWDPLAELPESQPEPAATAAAETAPEPSDADDDEDIDMFRAWLQSLKR